MRDRLTSDKPEEMNNRSVAELREKLKKYEDICMYPEKLKEISGLFLEKCQEVNRLKEDLEKQKNRSSRKQTNADRIHSMNIEELAEFIINNCDNPISEKNEDMCDYCEKNDDEAAKCDKEGCKKAIAEWLQSGVEE